MSDRNDKTEHIQERSVEYLQQINQMLQEKMNAARQHETLQSINAAMKLQVVELQCELERLQEEVPRREVVRPVMVGAPVNTNSIECVE